MKWITHQTAGVGAALALHLPLEGVVAACLGAILPDKLDQAIAKRSRNPQRTFNQIHRGTTHWFGWWVAILLVACSHLVPPHWQPALLGIGLGGISHVVLDTAAGMGVPFAAAKAVADRALLVVTPDPVALRDGRIVCDALTAGGCGDVRLVINRVPRSLAHTGIEDLDECIDTVGARLIGVVPESAPLAAASAHSAPLPGDDMAAKAFSAIAARLGGEQIPLVVR